MLLTLVIKQLALYYLIIINRTLFLIKMTRISELQACTVSHKICPHYERIVFGEKQACVESHATALKKGTCPLTSNFDRSGQKRILVVMAVTSLISRMLYLSSEQALGGAKRRNNLGNTAVVQVSPDFLEIILAFTYNHKAEI